MGREMTGLVGGRVEVTKRGAVGTALSGETVTHEPTPRLRRASKIQIFFMLGFYIAKIKNSCPDTSTACKCRDSEVGINQLRLGKYHGVEAVVIEEGVSHADLGKCSAHQILTVTRVTPVVDPPVDGLLPTERGIVAIDVFRD